MEYVIKLEVKEYLLEIEGLLRLLKKGKNLNMIEQKNKFVQIFNDYKGSYNRRDDITLIGIKV